MQITITEHVIRILIVAPQERVDAFNAPTLRKRVYQFLDEGAKNFVLNLSAVPFLDSAGLAVLVSVLKRARQAGGDVKMVWPKQEAARRILHLTKFDRVFDMAETTEAALQRF